MSRFICKFCSNPSKKQNVNSLRNHERLCSQNPNKQFSNLLLEKRDPWNKGLSVKNNPELKDSLVAGGISLANKIKDGWIPLWATPGF